MINFISVNIRGLMGCPSKRLKLYRLLKREKAAGLVQETFTTESDESTIKEEWGGEVIFNHGTKHSSGVILLLPKNTIYEDVFKDENGRVISCYLPSSDITLCNIYSPCHSKPKEQLPFFKDLITYTDNKPNLIL